MTGPRTITTSRSSTTTGTVLARRRLPEGLEGVTRLHALIAEQMPEDWADLEPGEAAGAGEGRDRDRPRPVGRRAGRGRAMRCSRSTRCRWPATGSGTPPRGRSPMPPMRTCWPRSSGWTGPITGRSPGTPTEAEAIKLAARTHQIADLGPHPARAAAARRRCGSTFPLPCRPSPTWTHPTRSSCWPRHPTPTGPPG